MHYRVIKLYYDLINGSEQEYFDIIQHFNKENRKSIKIQK